MRVAVVTVSDSCSLGVAEDVTGPMLKELAINEKKATVESVTVPDERILIESLLTELSDRHELIITTGGTGFAPRDVTPEATLAVIEKRCGGLETALHTYGLQKTPLAALSRLVCGIRGRCLIVNLPGSRGGVKDGWAVLSPLLEHAVGLITDADDGSLHRRSEPSKQASPAGDECD